jgi:Pvc16 N-terminal domain/Carboxypeptidase regulatory-like domain
MLADLHVALAQLLHVKGLIPAEDVDVRFEAPRRAWVSTLTRPTLDLFLYDVRENTELRHTNLQGNRANGKSAYRVPPRRFDLRYMVTALTTVPEDEHLLLWRTLVTLLKYAELPADIAPEAIRALDPPVIAQIKTPEHGGGVSDIWSALEESPRPALLYIVTVPVDLDLTISAPLVLTRTARYARTTDPTRPLEIYSHIGGRLRDRKGQHVGGARVALEGRAREPVVTDSAGQFTLVDVPAGQVTLRITPPDGRSRLVKIAVPAPSYDLTVD